MAAAQATWRQARWAVAALLAVVVAGALAPKPQPCGDLDPHYAPILAFEFARSVPDLHALFGPAPGLCRAAVTTALARVNWADCLLFIPIYGAFLILSLRAVGGTASAWTRRAMWAVLLACLADYAENACLFAIADAPDFASPALTALAWATGAKWLLLAVVGVVSGVLVTRHHPRLRVPVVSACVAGAAVVVAVQVDPAVWGRWASAGVAVGWLVLVVAVVVGRSSATPSPTPPPPAAPATAATARDP